jgi:hypothetical protein
VHQCGALLPDRDAPTTPRSNPHLELSTISLTTTCFHHQNPSTLRPHQPPTNIMKPTLAELQAYLDSDYIPPQQPAQQPQPIQPQVHLFTDLNWQTEEEPPLPNNPAYPQLYHLLTVTQQTLIGYYPHDTHELTQPNPHYIAWAPLNTQPNQPNQPILWN